jgi:hypothetical protein
MSEFLRSQQGVEQVNHQPGAHDQHNDGFSIHIDLALGDLSSANSIAELRVTDRQPEERHCHHDKDHILHSRLLQTQLAFATID